MTSGSTVKGGCLCGGIRYEIFGPIGAAVYCHCSMCRKFHGSAFRARVSVPKSSFRFVKGEDLLTSYRSSASKAPWHEITDDLPQYPGFPKRGS